MALDRALAREIKRVAPQRKDREEYFAFAKKVKAAKADMSIIEIRDRFNELQAKHGRPVTAIVVAATLWMRRERLDRWKLKWAMEVLDCWPHTPGLRDDAAIDDGIHPTALCDYAGEFIRVNEER